MADPAGRAPGRPGPRPRGLRPPGPGGQPRADGRARRARRASGSPTSPTWPVGSGWCSPAAARGPCPPRSSRRARPRPSGRSTSWSPPSGGTTSSSSCGTTATRSTPPATTRCPSWRSAGASALIATGNVHYATPASGAGWPRRWPRSGPGAASTTSTAGCPPAPAPTCARGASRPAGSPASPAWSRRRPSWAGRARSTCPWWPRTCRRTPVPTASTRWPSSRRLADATAPPAATATAPAPTVAGRRSARATPVTRAGVGQIDHELDVIEALGFPGYFLIVWDIVEFCRAGRHLLPGPGLGGQLRGVLRARASPRPTPSASACCSSGSCRPSATARPTSTSTSRAAAARRSSSTSTSATGGRTPPRSPTSSPTGRAPRCGTWPRRSAPSPASRTPGPSSSTPWGGIGRTAGRRRPRDPEEVWSWRPRSSTSPGTSASTPAAWCCATGRWSRCARWSGPAWRTAASCSGTRTTAPRSAW